VPEDIAVQCAFCGAVNEPTVMQRPRAPSGAPPAVQMVIGHELPQIARRADKVGLVATTFSLVITFVVIAIAVGGVWYGLHQAAPHQVPRLPFEKR
jgi:hypothetical protein